MNLEWYIGYHMRGDASVEERFAADFIKAAGLNSWDAFRFLYYYALTYSLPSAIRLLQCPSTPRQSLVFRTDRRYVGICGRFEKCMKALNRDMQTALHACRTTAEQYRLVTRWYYFGRYAAYLFLECFYKLNPCIIDNLRMKWIPRENYAKGAAIVSGCRDQRTLDAFVEVVKQRTGDNVFSIETSLCAVEKIRKGTRWDGFYTERFLRELQDAGMSKYMGLVSHA